MRTRTQLTSLADGLLTRRRDRSNPPPRPNATQPIAVPQERNQWDMDIEDETLRAPLMEAPESPRHPSPGHQSSLEPQAISDDNIAEDLPAPAKVAMTAELSRTSTGTMICTVIGEVDLLTAPTLVDTLRTATQSGPAHLIVDLSGVTFLGSHGLRALVDASTTQDSEHNMYLVADTAAVNRPLHVTGLAEVLARFPDLDAALTACASPRPK
jgi:anti-sigma B factor antagonist